VPPATAGPTQGATSSTVRDLGWMHPQGSTYIASLFTPDGRTLNGVASRGKKVFDWVTCSAQGTGCVAVPLSVPAWEPTVNELLLYGSSIRDASGAHFIVGTRFVGGNLKPIMLRVRAR